MRDPPREARRSWSRALTDQVSSARAGRLCQCAPKKTTSPAYYSALYSFNCIRVACIRNVRSIRQEKILFIDGKGFQRRRNH